MFVIPGTVISIAPIAASDGGLAYLKADAGPDITELRNDGGVIGLRHFGVATATTMRALTSWKSAYIVGGDTDTSGAWGASFAMGSDAGAMRSNSTTRAFVDVAANDAIPLLLLVKDGNSYATVDPFDNIDELNPSNNTATALALVPNETGHDGMDGTIASLAVNSAASQSPKLELTSWGHPNAGGNAVIQATFFQGGEAFTITSETDPIHSHAFAYGEGLIAAFQTTDVSLFVSAIGEKTVVEPAKVTDAENLIVHAALSTNKGTTYYVGGCTGESDASVTWLARLSADDTSFTLSTGFGTNGIRTFPELPKGSCIQQLREDDAGNIVALVSTLAGFSALVRMRP